MAFWATLPVPTLLNWVPDDSFYYFQPASLMARGYVPSFDAVNPGNGFHPLWMWMLVPIFKLKTVNADLPVHLALLLGGLLYVATGFLIYRILKTAAVDGIYAALAGGTFPLWPSAITTAADGEVTPITVLVLAAGTYYYLRLISKPAATFRDGLTLALFAALVVLARADNIIAVALFAVHYLTLKRTENKIAGLALVAAVTAGTTAGWLGWLYAFSGELFPTSGTAVPLMTKAAVWRDWPSAAGGVISGIRLIHGWLPSFLSYFPGKEVILVFYVIVIGVALWRPGKFNTFARVLFLLIIFVITIFIINAAVRRYFRHWHLGAAFLVNQLAFWFGLYYLFRHFRWHRRVAYVVAGVFAVLFVVDGFWTARHPYYPWQKEMLAGGRWAAAQAPTLVGAFNGGIIAYYAADNVVNLDGNMNVGSYRALRERRLYDYCKRAGVRYIADYEVAVRERYRDFWPADKGRSIMFVSDKLDIKTGPKQSHKFYIYKII